MPSAFDLDPALHEEANDLRDEHAAASQNGEDSPWPVLDEAALYGLPGDVVRCISPHSEADPVAILIQFLVAAGNVIGRGPHYFVEGDRHQVNLYAGLVGETSKGRKGTAWGRVRQLMEVADPEWHNDRIVSGLSSGEGLIWAVRDPLMGFEKGRKNKKAPPEEIIVDPGVSDKRLMVVQTELEQALAVMKREGNILSAVIRDAWDRGNLRSLTKHSPAKATGAHVSLIGHITTSELRAALDRTSMANGSANRVLWVMVRRARLLPFGGHLEKETIKDLGWRAHEAIIAARDIGRVKMSSDTKLMWRTVYPKLSAGGVGLLGMITNRGEAQTIRLAMLYALLDGQDEIGPNHLRAALAVWEYCEASAAYIWGDTVGDPVADEILQTLRSEGEKTRTEISAIFGRNRNADQIDRALKQLVKLGKIVRGYRETGGRRAQIWRAVAGG